MAETAATRLNRIALMLAELNRDGRDGHNSIAELAASLGVTTRDVMRDLHALGEAQDNPSGGALANIRFGVEKGRVHALTGGPFRRPLTLGRDEALALRVAIATDPDADEALERLTRNVDAGGEQIALRTVSGFAAESVAALLLSARQQQRGVEITYVGEADTTGRARVIEPHLLVEFHGAEYVVAWCETSAGRRLFRIERILDARVLDREFAIRPELLEFAAENEVDDRAADPGDEVTVRFTSFVAPWLREQHPDAREEPDGSLTVTYRVWNPSWLVTHVLQYGAEAEVVGPVEYRDMMRRAVG